MVRRRLQCVSKTVIEFGRLERARNVQFCRFTPYMLVYSLPGTPSTKRHYYEGSGGRHLLRA